MSETKETKIKVVGKSCCSTCGIQGHNKNNKRFHPIVPVCLLVAEESDDEFENCDCGYIHHYEDKCPQGNACEHYEKWREEEEEEEEDCCFKCGIMGLFGETHFYAQPEEDGEENLYCIDCDVKSWYDN